MDVSDVQAVCMPSDMHVTIEFSSIWLVASLSISLIGSLKIHTSMRTNHLSVFALWCMSFHGVRERCGGVRWCLHSVYHVSVLWKFIHPWGQTISQCLHFGVSCLSMAFGRGVGVCAGVFTQYISYRFFENPYIREDKPSLSVCTLVNPVFPWCSGEVWGCALVASLSISRIG
jgi:hypothetical protein